MPIGTRPTGLAAPDDGLDMLAADDAAMAIGADAVAADVDVGVNPRAAAA